VLICHGGSEGAERTVAPAARVLTEHSKGSALIHLPRGVETAVAGCEAADDGGLGTVGGSAWLIAYLAPVLAPMDGLPSFVVVDADDSAASPALDATGEEISASESIFRYDAPCPPEL
jgi:hypothetical protein